LSAYRDPLYGCLLADGRVDRDGYAFRGKSRAHIVAWVERNGPVPAEHVLDHLCRRRNCCEPLHLEPVTQSRNEHRKRWAVRLRITTCQAGHSMDGALVTPEGGRLCRTCTEQVLRSPSPNHGP
jgi:HNH endonuclease